MARKQLLAVFALAAASACYSGSDEVLDAPGGKADHPIDNCLFGETTDQWEEGIDGLDIEDGWNVVDADTELWDGALEQIIVTLDFPGGPTTFAGALAETDDKEFRWKEISDRNTGVGYIVWAYIGGDNLHGAIFDVESDVALARLSDEEIAHCTVEAQSFEADCSTDEGDEPTSAKLLPTTGELVEVDAVDRIVNASLYDRTDTDWFVVTFSPDNRCIDCFNPYAEISKGAEAIAEVCVFVAQYEAQSRGGETGCFGGESADEPGLVGCCTTEVDSIVNFDTTWDHEARDESTMYIRVKAAEAPAAAESADTCELYQVTYGHFTG